MCVEDRYRYITIKGSAELDYDAERSLEGIRDLAIRYHGQEKGERLTRDTYSKQERVNIYVTIESIDVYEF
jgi:hypothetical protein